MLNRTCRILAVAIAVLAASSAGLAEGVDTYKAKCQMCHGADGVGDTPAGKAMKAVSFKDAAILAKSDADLIAATTNGKNKMPAYKGKLTDAEIKAVIAYIHTLQKK
jgi:cytochrome c6